MPDNDHPDRIIICSATGDWIEWEKPRLPEEMDCPHGGCHCTPTLYDQRRTNAEVAALRRALFVALVAPPYDDDSDRMEEHISTARAWVAAGCPDG